MKVSVGPASSGVSGWSAFSLAKLAFLAAVIALVVIVLENVRPDIVLPVAPPLILVACGAVGLFCSVGHVLFVPSAGAFAEAVGVSVGRSFGVFIAALAAGALTYGGWRRMQEFLSVSAGRFTYPSRVVTRRNASLKPQLNQIRAWVQEGATDIWIAHKLGSTPASISRFRRQHDLRRSDEAPGPAAATVTEAEVAESASEAPAKRTRRAKPAKTEQAKPAAKPATRSRSKKTEPAAAEAAPEAEFTAPPEVVATADAS